MNIPPHTQDSGKHADKIATKIKTHNRTSISIVKGDCGFSMSMHKHRLGSARFGVTTFFAYTHPSDQVGPDGLPVTPSAVRILGRFSLLKELNHKNLTAYIDIARLKNGMINLS